MSVTYELEAIFANEGSVLPVDCEFDGVKLTGRFFNECEIVSLSAVASFDYTAPCDRCATQVTKHYDIPIEHILVTHLDNENNDEYVVIPDMHIDICPLVHEDLILSMPTKFLCSEDCKGICPGCKKNLNYESCICEKETDPRFDILKQLLDK